MFTHARHLVSAELFQLRHRVSTWVLLLVWAAMGLFFGYIFLYLVETPDSGSRHEELAELLPDQFVAGVTSGFPFYGGAIALMLGVLSVGSEFGWGTFKTLFTQRPGRGAVFGAKIAALAIVLLPFVLVVFVVGAAASAFIAWREGLDSSWPGIQSIVEAIAAGWLILAAWAVVGVTLAVVTRGTSLAIGIGIMWALVVEGLLSAFATSISWLAWTNDIMLRTNAYSLVQPLGGAGDDDGPGVFTGPYVSVTQALALLTAYIVGGLVLSMVLLRRDVT
jgi:ABC-2 type transport system permease protein